MTVSPTRLLLMVATRKGAWLYHGDPQRQTWRRAMRASS